MRHEAGKKKKYIKGGRGGGGGGGGGHYNKFSRKRTHIMSRLNSFDFSKKR